MIYVSGARDRGRLVFIIESCVCIERVCVFVQRTEVFLCMLTSGFELHYAAPLCSAPLSCFRSRLIMVNYTKWIGLVDIITRCVLCTPFAPFVCGAEIRSMKTKTMTGTCRVSVRKCVFSVQCVQCKGGACCGDDDDAGITTVNKTLLHNAEQHNHFSGAHCKGRSVAICWQCNSAAKERTHTYAGRQRPNETITNGWRPLALSLSYIGSPRCCVWTKRRRR